MQSQSPKLNNEILAFYEEIEGQESLQGHASNHLGNFTCVCDTRSAQVVNPQLLFRADIIKDLVLIKHFTGCSL